jgi:hypothetical protein
MSPGSSFWRRAIAQKGQVTVFRSLWWHSRQHARMPVDSSLFVTGYGFDGAAGMPQRRGCHASAMPGSNCLPALLIKVRPPVIVIAARRPVSAAFLTHVPAWWPVGRELGWYR